MRCSFVHTFLVGGALLLATLIAAPAAAETRVFTHRDADGITSFSDAPGGATRTAYRTDFGRETATATCVGLDRAALDARAATWRPLIAATATRHAVPADLFEALVRIESCFDPDARSRAGAEGLAQLMPPTARELSVTDSFDARANLDGGARYLARMLARFGEPHLALAAYNAGPGNVTRHGGVPPFPETRAYVQRVLAARERAAPRVAEATGARR